MTKTEKKTSPPPKKITCKVIPDSTELPRSSKQWTRAQRCTLEFKENGLTFLKNYLPYEEIENAMIHIYPSAFFFEYGILSITIVGKTHHFGIQYTDSWKADLPFAVERIYEETPFILFRRSLIILILIYIFWEVVKK